MAISFKPALTLALAALACGGCTQVDHGLGEALKYDMAMQTIDPDPIYPPGSAEPGTSGTTAADAAKRYRTGSVKQVEVQSTTAATGGTGTGSGPK